MEVAPSQDRLAAARQAEAAGGSRDLPVLSVTGVKRSLCVFLRGTHQVLGRKPGARRGEDEAMSQGDRLETGGVDWKAGLWPRWSMRT